MNLPALCIVEALAIIVAGCIIVALTIENARLRSSQGYDAETIRYLKSEIAPFDQDHDGKAGGSVRKRA